MIKKKNQHYHKLSMYKAVCIKSAITLGKSLPYILGASCSFLFAYTNAGPKTLKWNVISTCYLCLADQTIQKLHLI